MNRSVFYLPRDSPFARETMFTPDRQIRVVVSEGQPITRAGIVAALEAEPDLSVVAVSSTASQALLHCRRLSPDIALLDLSGEDGRDTLTAIEQFAALGKGRVIVFASSEGMKFAFSAIKAGAAGALAKTASIADLVATIRRAHAGQIVLPLESTDELLDSLTRPELTPRELQVLALIAEGHANKEIATRLDITKATVQVHARNIFVKLEVAGRTEAAMVALRRGMLPFQGFMTSHDPGTRLRGSQMTRRIERARHARSSGTG
jgi:DNA-binding NarL/FixJ family response regulator